ncbi:hypothetical protein MRB53_036243 [Persea americana]|nr:hypothetical protein MRB53_042440 [Persea americana]KAJ8614096.1 hypothetical protein MRB53_036717 [Persea americana]KAJ8614356.1 hypothetical protein MRB53_036637 [Persea americana]KAJ8614830.1 hypothetical protein MRB53_036243 [Persea americana]
MVSNQRRADRVVEHNKCLGLPVKVKSSWKGSAAVEPKADRKGVDPKAPSVGVDPKADIPPVPAPEHPEKSKGGAAFTYYNMMNAEGDSGTQLPLPASSGTSSSDSTAKPSPSALDQRADELLEKNIEALKTSLGEGERISEVRETVKDNFDVKTPGEEYELIQNIEGEVHLNEKQCDGEKSINMKSSLNEVTEKRGDCPITITELNEIKNHEALIQYGKGGGPFEVEWGLIRPPAGIRFCPTFGRYYEQTERRLGLISLKKEYVGSRGQPGPVIFWFCFRGFLESLLFIVVRNKVAVGSPTAGLNPSRSTLTME